MMADMVATTSGSTSPRPAARSAVLVLPAVVCLSLLGCTGDSEGDPAPSPAPAPLEISLEEAADELSPQARDDLQTEVGDALSAYVVDAFLGDYPRDDFVEKALDSFSTSVAAKAATDLDVITGAGFGEVDEVSAKKLLAHISPMVRGDRTDGASVRVAFDFETVRDGEPSEQQLTGRLMLTPEGDAWKIFGYRLQLDDGSAPS